MDLMRTLLIYMTATMTLAVQNTAAPKETPAPTPAPDAIVQTVDMPGQDGDTITAVPPEQAVKLADITPLPVPLITPNNKAYHNLTMGAKGKEVRKLQEKLVELGYLPEGAVDGAYGRQTYNAIKKFQRYNGLTADGIAGRKTQTNLFENPDIAPNPEVTRAPEATPAPEVTPAPVATPVPEEISAPEAAPEVTEAPEAEEPADEAEPVEEPAAEEPEVEPAEAAEAEAEPAEEPAAEEPAAEETATEAPAAETAEAPEAEETAAEAAEPEDEPDVVENVDLDADVYEPFTAMVALNEGNGPLEYIVTEDGVPVTARPRLSRNGDRIRISLDDMCAAVEKWQLTDDNVGTVVLEAAGYTLVLYNEAAGSSATLDGREISMKDDDFDFSTDGHFINVEFLASALKGEALWDEEENTLMLRIRDREAVESAD